MQQWALVPLHPEPWRGLWSKSCLYRVSHAVCTTMCPSVLLVIAYTRIGLRYTSWDGLSSQSWQPNSSYSSTNSYIMRGISRTGFGEPQVQIGRHMYKDAHSLDSFTILNSSTVMAKNHVTWSQPHSSSSLCFFSVSEYMYHLSLKYYQQHNPKKGVIKEPILRKKR